MTILQFFSENLVSQDKVGEINISLLLTRVNYYE